MKRIGINKKHLFCLIVAAIVLLLFSELDFQSSISAANTSKERDLESKIEEMVLTLDGVSDVEVMVTLDSYEEEKRSPYVRGVSIICHGKAREETKIKIIMMISTALGLSSDKIFVTFT